VEADEAAQWQTQLISFRKGRIPQENLRTTENKGLGNHFPKQELDPKEETFPSPVMMCTLLDFKIAMDH
jgi:hypothetical protein